MSGLSVVVWMVLLTACPSPETPKADPEGDDTMESYASGIDLDNDGSNADIDCDDANAGIHPGAEEACDGVDQDCDGYIDESLELFTWYSDGDGDGFGVDSHTESACSQPNGTVDVAGDCADDDGLRFPGADELCNGTDDDCDDQIDEGLSGDVASYRDADDDGYGDAGSIMMACAPISDGYASNADDCDDADEDVNPSSSEVCDGLDNDCDGVADDAAALDAIDWYADDDGDGFGDEASVVRSCTAPSGHVSDATDCDDANSRAWPGADERCDGSDNDCDGLSDEADAIDPLVWTKDGDFDGYGAESGETTLSCSVPFGYAGTMDDCDDTNVAIHPGATELPNGMDDNCAGGADEGISTGEGAGGGGPTVHCSADESDCSSALSSNGLDDDCDGDPDDDCDQDNDGDGQSENEGDCDDSDRAVYYSEKKGFDPFGLWISPFDDGDSYDRTALGDVNGDGMKDAIVIDSAGYIYVALATLPADSPFADSFVRSAAAWWPPAGDGTALDVFTQDYTSDSSGSTLTCSSLTLITPWGGSSIVTSSSGATIESAEYRFFVENVDGDADDDLVVYIGDVDGTDPRCGNGCQNDSFDGSWYVLRSTGTAFSAPEVWATSTGWDSDELRLADVDGDGAADIVAWYRADGDAIGCPEGCYPNTGDTDTLLDENCPEIDVYDHDWLVALATDSDGDGLADSWGTLRPFKYDFGCTTSGSGACNVDGRWVADVTGDGKADLVCADLDTDTWLVAVGTGSAFGTATTWRSTGSDLGPYLGAFDSDGDGASGVLFDRDGDGDIDPDDSPDLHYAIDLADVNGDLAADIVFVGVESTTGDELWSVAIATPDGGGSGSFVGELDPSSADDEDVWASGDVGWITGRFFAGNVNETDDDDAGPKSLADAVIYTGGSWYVATALGQQCSSEPEL